MVNGISALELTGPGDSLLLRADGVVPHVERRPPRFGLARAAPRGPERAAGRRAGVRLLAAAAGLLLAAGAAAAPFSSRSGGSGLLDVPDADVLERGSGLFLGELRFDRAAGTANELGPLPIALGVGLGLGAEVGFSMREWGWPGDPRPSPTLMATDLKVRLGRPTEAFPELALRLGVDRFNWKATGTADVAFTAESGRVRLAGFAGAELHRPALSVGPRLGAAAEIRYGNGAGAVVEGIAGPGGLMFGGALRWALTPAIGVSLGADWLPRQDGLRVSLGFAFASLPPRRERPVRVEAAPVEEKPGPRSPAAPTFTDARPHFRMRIPTLQRANVVRKHLQHGPIASASGRPATKADDRPVSPAAADARARQIAGPQARLDAREKELTSGEAAPAARLEQLEVDARQLDAREQELDDRERRLRDQLERMNTAGPPSAVERELEAREAELRSSEARFLDEERGHRASADAARSRDRGARLREERLRTKAARLGEELRTASKREQLALSAGLAATRERILAIEAERLAAARERADATEKAAAARGGRLASHEQRLEALAARLRAREDRGKRGAGSSEAGSSEAPEKQAREGDARP